MYPRDEAQTEAQEKGQIHRTESQQRISLPVGELRLRLSVPRSSERLFRLAGEEIALTLKSYKTRYARPAEADETSLLAMSCVDIAYRSLALREEELSYQGLSRLSRLNEEIEQELAKHLPTGRP